MSKVGIIVNDKQRIAGLIFVSGEEGVDLNTLSETLSLESEVVLELIEKILNDYSQNSDIPIFLDCYNHHYRFLTKPELEDDLIKFARTPLMQKLSRFAVETLAIIAYRQPITRMGIDEIRGVSSQNMLQKLQSRNLIRSVGHVDAPGRPILYGVTDYFLSYFGLNSIEDLPEIEDLALNAELVTDSLFSTDSWILNGTEDERKEENNG